MVFEHRASRPTAAHLLKYKCFCSNSPIQRVSSEPIVEAGVQGDGSPTPGASGDGQRTPVAGFEFKALPVDELPARAFDAVVCVRKLNPHLEPGDLSAFVDGMSRLGRDRASQLLFHYILAVGKYPSFVHGFTPELAKLQERFTGRQLYEACAQGAIQWSKASKGTHQQEEMFVFDDQRMGICMGVTKLFEELGVLKNIRGTAGANSFFPDKRPCPRHGARKACTPI